MAVKKLIEVALPLDAINAASAREKSIRHGHPSTLHLWWARRPLAAARAVIWSSLVDDPSSHPELFPTEEAQTKERERLFEILEKLVKWENSNDKETLDAAKAEIRNSMGSDLPALLDPFAGGGAIPLEAQRLGLEPYAQDLNPVAVTINKAMIEIPPVFAGKPAVNPDAQERVELDDWKGNSGLAADVEFYGRWMKDEAYKRIGKLYPQGCGVRCARRRRGHRHRMAMGPHRHMPEPGMRRRRHPRAFVRLVQKEGQGMACRTHPRTRRSTIRGQTRQG